MNEPSPSRTPKVSDAAPSGVHSTVLFDPSMENDPIYQQALKEAMAVNEAYQKAVQRQSPSQSEGLK